VVCLFLIVFTQARKQYIWGGINCKQSTRWQHLSQLKASAFFSLQKKICYETQQLILGTGTAIWWVTEPHCRGHWWWQFKKNENFSIEIKSLSKIAIPKTCV